MMLALYFRILLLLEMAARGPRRPKGHALRLPALHFQAIAEEIEAEFRRRAIRDVVAIGGGARVVGHLHLQVADVETDGGVDGGSPFGVAAGQVIVDRGDVDTLAEHGVESDGTGGNEGLAFAGRDFSERAIVQDNA